MAITLVTGFLGALRHFSSFAGEVIEHSLEDGKWVIRFSESFTWLLNFYSDWGFISLGSSVFYSISDKIAKFFRIKSPEEAYAAKFCFAFSLF